MGHKIYNNAPWQASGGGLVLLADEAHNAQRGESIGKKGEKNAK
jgi:hypothetical protein